MQCLVAPTRKEADAAHSKAIWLDIGVPSVKNLRHISLKMVVLWWLLVISTMPLHLLWNSVIFSTLQTNDYAVVVVSADFLSDDGPHCTDFLATSNDTDVICEMYEAAKAGTLTELEVRDCITHYNTKLQNRWSNVFVVSNDILDSESLRNISNSEHSRPSLNWTSLYLEFQSTTEWYQEQWSYEPVLPSPSNPTAWLCSQELFSGSCNLTEALNSSHWTILGNVIHSGFLIDHCLAAKAAESCKLQYSFVVLPVIIMSNFIKLVAIIITLRTVKEQHFITIGDAISSFLSTPDLSVKESCLASKSGLRSMFTPKLLIGSDHREHP